MAAVVWIRGRPRAMIHARCRMCASKGEGWCSAQLAISRCAWKVRWTGGFVQITWLSLLPCVSTGERVRRRRRQVRVADRRRTRRALNAALVETTRHRVRRSLRMPAVGHHRRHERGSRTSARSRAIRAVPTVSPGERVRWRHGEPPRCTSATVQHTPRTGVERSSVDPTTT